MAWVPVNLYFFFRWWRDRHMAAASVLSSASGHLWWHMKKLFYLVYTCIFLLNFSLSFWNKSPWYCSELLKVVAEESKLGKLRMPLMVPGTWGSKPIVRKDFKALTHASGGTALCPFWVFHPSLFLLQVGFSWQQLSLNPWTICTKCIWEERKPLSSSSFLHIHTHSLGSLSHTPWCLQWVFIPPSLRHISHWGIIISALNSLTEYPKKKHSLTSYSVRKWGKNVVSISPVWYKVRNPYPS